MTAVTHVDGRNNILRTETPSVWFPCTVFATPNSVSNEETAKEVNYKIYMILQSCIYNVNATYLFSFLGCDMSCVIQ